MKKYSSLFRIRFTNALQYRLAAIAGLMTQFAWGFMFILMFSAFYRTNPEAFPMEFSQVVSYIWIQQAFLALFMVWMWDNEIYGAIESGFIAYELVRPIDLYNRWFCQACANRIARALLRCAPILIVAFVLPEPFRMTLPTDMIQFMLFLISMVLALGVVVAFTMLIVVSAFHTISSVGTRFMLFIISDFLAGAIIPLPFFPDSVRPVVELLPFAAMQNMPLRIFNGDISGNAAINGIILQLFWLIILILIGRFLMSQALKKVIVQGG
jgi:ABC-2 type transport system permease protein